MVMALEGIRVVDMTVWHHGPGGGTFLADMGAEVIKVEERQSGDPGRHGGSLGGVENDLGLSYYFENNNRDKKSLAINLKTEKGHEVITRLLKKSDIFLSNMRKSGLGRLGLSYDEVKEINPEIVYAHGSGQGDKGPLLNRQSNDIIGQFWGAYVSYGSAEGPMSIWSDFADRGGAVMLAYGAALALLGRERHGISQEVNTSLLGGQVHLGALNFQQRLFEGKAVSPLSNGEGHLPNPLYNIYQDSEGAWFCIGAEGTDAEWSILCQAIGSRRRSRRTHASIPSPSAPTATHPSCTKSCAPASPRKPLSIGLQPLIRQPSLGPASAGIPRSSMTPTSSKTSSSPSLTIPTRASSTTSASPSS